MTGKFDAVTHLQITFCDVNSGNRRFCKEFDYFANFFSAMINPPSDNLYEPFRFSG